MVECFKSKNIPLNNMVGFSSDTCNVMTGEHSSVFSRLKKENPNIVCVKCFCHSIHLAAFHACLKLPRSTEDFLRNLGGHFNRSFCRQEALKEFQEFFQTDIHKILSPSITRWLSVESCVNRVLEQYAVLEAYLTGAVFDDPFLTLNNMLATIKIPFTLAYLEFLSYVLAMLNRFNCIFQGETPLLHSLQPQVGDSVKDLYSNFLEIKHLKTGISSVLDIDHTNPDLFVSLQQVYLGVSTSETIVSLNEKNVPTPDINKFYKTCLDFYVELVSQIKNRFDFSVQMFELIRIVEPIKAQELVVNTLIPVLKRFPVLNDFVEKQNLDSEWRAHSLLNHALLELNAQQYWSTVFKIKTGTGENLKKVITFLLVLPFSNASVERVFSELKLCKTAYRNKLKTSNSCSFDGHKRRSW